MFLVRPAWVRLLAGALSVMIVAAWGTGASAQVLKKLSFQELVKKSDTILVATCTQRKAVFKNGNIVTRYNLKPSEYWKGTMALSSEGEFQMEEMGGALEGPIPLAQAVPGMVDLAKNEETLLFCANQKAQAQRAGVKAQVDPKSPYVVGRWQGHYTVFPHPESGEKIVGHASLSETPGSPTNPGTRATMLKLSQNAARADGASSGLKPNVMQRTNDRLRARKLAQRIDKAAARAKAEREAQAAKDPTAADEIYQYEPLSAIKMRVMREVNNIKH